MGWFLIAAGTFAICGAVLDWNWFMNNRKAQFFVRLFGRAGTRLFYVILGTILIIMGALMLTGVIKDTGTNG